VTRLPMQSREREKPCISVQFLHLPPGDRALCVTNFVPLPEDTGQDNSSS
jgi:hypothetical protein